MNIIPDFMTLIVYLGKEYIEQNIVYLRLYWVVFLKSEYL